MLKIKGLGRNKLMIAQTIRIYVQQDGFGNPDDYLLRYDKSKRPAQKPQQLFVKKNLLEIKAFSLQ